jgi:hypothetical protein
MMLLLLPLSFALIARALRRAQPTLDFRAVLIRSSLIWAGVLVTLTEGLSLLRLLTPSALGAAWAVIAAAAAWTGQRFPLSMSSPANWRIPCPGSWLGRVALFTIGLSLVATALVAWRTPPQTWDSLTYHMPRVAHWAQERAVVPFATGNETQNAMPPGAEVIVLHVYLLGGGDRWVNFVSWFAWAGTILAVSYLAKLLGAGEGGQALAAVFAASLPTAIIQSTSTMTDGVLALWVCAAAAEVLGFVRREAAAATVFGSLAAGLAVLTKPTAGAFLAPFALWGAWEALRGCRAPQALGRIVLVFALVLGLNFGHWARNLALYGSPIASTSRVTEHANGMPNLRGLISNLTRNLALQLGTPSPYVNKALALTVRQIHEWMGLDPSDPRTTAAGVFRVGPPTTHENRTANLVATLFLILVTAGVVWDPRLRRTKAGALLLAVGAGIFLFSFLFKWQIFGRRYVLPAFVLAAPVFGWTAESRLPRWVLGLLMGALFLTSLPWTLANRTRPLLTLPDASVASVLLTPRTSLMFANGPYLGAPYSEIADRIHAVGCGAVGLELAGNSAEYPLWVLLGAPWETTRLEWIVSDTDSARWSDPSFQACAVICEGCEDEAAVRGLPLAYEHGPLRLFLAAP